MERILNGVYFLVLNKWKDSSSTRKNWHEQHHEKNLHSELRDQVRLKLACSAKEVCKFRM